MQNQAAKLQLQPADTLTNQLTGRKQLLAQLTTIKDFLLLIDDYLTMIFFITVYTHNT
jgi:hypothetical protein